MNHEVSGGGQMKALQFSVTVPKFIAAKDLATIFGKRDKPCNGDILPEPF